MCVCVRGRERGRERAIKNERDGGTQKGMEIEREGGRRSAEGVEKTRELGSKGTRCEVELMGGANCELEGWREGK